MPTERDLTPSPTTEFTLMSSQIRWADVSHLCFPGSTVDVPCWVPRRNQSLYVLFEEEEDGVLVLTLHDGSMVSAQDYCSPLGWVPPAQAELIERA